MTYQKLALVSFMAALSSSLASISLPTQAAEEVIEEVVTIGTRGKPRSATDSTAAVDVISAADFLSQGEMDTNNLLRNLVPSFNVNDQPVNDATILVKPANLRGLAPDHTLVLVNGKRRHRGSAITWLGNGSSDGSQGPDIGAIPALALKSVEVLRDGAAAQYGSDAIAGVINFNLKDSDSESAIEVRHGVYKEGDGETYSVAVNKGFSLGGKGFLNLTGEFTEQEATNRSIQQTDAAALAAAGFPVENPVQVWGLPEVEDDIKLWANFSRELGAGVELFGQANHNHKKATGSFFYRNPLTRDGVYSSTNDNGTPDNETDDFSQLLVADLTANGSGNCSQYAVNSSEPTSPELANALAGLAADENCFNFGEILPGGFTPSFGGEVTDQSLLLGLRGTTEREFEWSFSAYYGAHESDFFLLNTVNASLGADSPTDFDVGSYGQEDISLNADFSMPLSDAVSLAFGTEYREENFSISAGQIESYIDGGLGIQGFSTSSNGFPGLSSDISGDFSRENYAVYADSEWALSDNFLAAGAIRHEDFEGFGGTTNFKLGANWSIIDNFGVRATFSTGFKAPTPGQSNASNITTQILSGVLVNQGVIPSNSPVARLRGGEDLDAEKSTNITLGVYLALAEFDITLDYFNIDVNDRLSFSKNYELTEDERTSLQGQGIDASDISEFRFFTNQFDTNTSGFDLVITTDTEWLNDITAWSLAANYTDTEVTSFDPEILDNGRIKLIENGIPDTRINFSANHAMDSWRLLARLNYYSDFYDNEADGTFDAAYTVDLEASYQATEHLSFALGGRNILDETGCSLDNCSTSKAGELGLPSSQYSPFGFNGAYYYGRLMYEF